MPTLANITTQTVVKSSAGKVKQVSVVVAGSAVGTINDAATTGTAAAGNVLIGLPNTAGIQPVAPGGWLFGTGIVVTPGTGQTISIDFE